MDREASSHWVSSLPIVLHLFRANTDPVRLALQVGSYNQSKQNELSNVQVQLADEDSHLYLISNFSFRMAAESCFLWLSFCSSPS